MDEAARAAIDEQLARYSDEGKPLAVYEVLGDLNPENDAEMIDYLQARVGERGDAALQERLNEALALFDARNIEYARNPYFMEAMDTTALRDAMETFRDVLADNVVTEHSVLENVTPDAQAAEVPELRGRSVE